MALSVVDVLTSHWTIDQDVLSRAFAERFAQQPFRGYGSRRWLFKRAPILTRFREKPEAAFSEQKMLPLDRL